LNDKTCETINKSALLHKRLMNKILERFSLTYAQYQVLKTIKTHSSLTAKEILVYMDTDKATLSGVLSRLERQNLIIRTKDPEDKRLMHIQLTERSNMLCDQVSQVEMKCADALTENIKGRELKNFFSVFERILENQQSKLEEETKRTKEARK